MGYDILLFHLPCYVTMPGMTLHYYHHNISFYLHIVAIVLNMGGNGGGSTTSATAAALSNIPGATSSYHLGLLYVGAASMLSGLSAALTQRAVTGAKQRNTFILSAEMAVYGIIFLLLNLYFNNDIKSAVGGGVAGGVGVLKGPNMNLFVNWNLATLIPVLTNVSTYVFVCIYYCR